MWVQPLSQEDPLEQEMETHSSILVDHSFGKTIVLTIRTFVGKVMSLLFNNFNFKIINVLY